MDFGQGPTEAMINMAGEEIKIYSNATTFKLVRAEITTVETTSFSLLRAGLRPEIDKTANVAAATTVQRGWKVLVGSELFEVHRIEEQKDGDSLVVSKQLLLLQLEPGGVDLDA